MNLIYVASPYTHESEDIRHARFEAVAAYTAKLLAARVTAYSPIVHGHTLTNYGKLPLDHNFWMHQCEAILRYAHMVHVLKLVGWDTSKGVAHEINFAQNVYGIPVIYVDPQ